MTTTKYIRTGGFGVYVATRDPAEFGAWGSSIGSALRAYAKESGRPMREIQAAIAARTVLIAPTTAIFDPTADALSSDDLLAKFAKDEGFKGCDYCSGKGWIRERHKDERRACAHCDGKGKRATS